MARTYWEYVAWNAAISGAIVLVIVGFLLISIWKFQNVFYMITKLMFKIKLCDDNSDHNKKTEATTQATNTTTVQPFTQPSKIRTSATTNISKESPQQRSQSLSSLKEKQIIDLYGKRIDGGKLYNKLALLLLITAVFGTTCVALYQGCLLVDVYVYPDGPCPSYGVMDCYYGSSQTYFNCSVGVQISGTLFNESATCFRFIAKDVSVNDVVTQFGACAGLLHALCAIIQLVLRYLVYSFRKRPLTPKESEKRVATTKSLKLTYKHPWYILISVLLLTLLMFAPMVGISLCAAYKISTCALTYVLLIIIVATGFIAFYWVILAENGSNEQFEDQQTDDSMIAGNMNETKVSGEENTNEKRPGRGKRPKSSTRDNVVQDFNVHDALGPIVSVFQNH